MIRLDTSGIAAFNRAVMLEMARLDLEISQEFVKWTTRICTDLIKGSAQFSGDMTANWNYSVNVPDFSYAETPLKYEYAKPHSLLTPLHMGHPDAVNTALAKMQAAQKPTWRDVVYMANATPIAEAVQEQRIALRPVNLVAGQAITIDYIVRREQMRGSL